VNDDQQAPVREGAYEMSVKFWPPAGRLLFGAAFYHEYQPAYLGCANEERLRVDLDLMRRAGFNVVRVGESVWSTWEPENGVFDLDWLAPVLDAAYEREISAVLGTPTYAVPMWMPRQHPEIAAVPANGRALSFGSRQEMDFTNPAYRFYAERLIRKVVSRYRDHPAVIGYQVDNEPGLVLLHNRDVFQGFVDHLRHLYGDVATLNREWGLVYWSHRLTCWADLWPPDGNVQPQYDLAWRRFQAGLVSEFIAWQAEIVRELARPDQFVTTCIAYDRPGVEDVDIASALDIMSGNAYYEMQDGFGHPSARPRVAGWVAQGIWAVYELADRMYSSKQAPFLVTETNAASIGGSSTNMPAYDGQWRQAAWALVSRGARMIEYWPWQSLDFGAETYWGGVLPHSQVPGRVYREVARIGEEFASVGPLACGAVPDYDIAVLYDTDSKFALAGQSPLVKRDGPSDPDSYWQIVTSFYRGAFDAGLQVRFVRPRQLFGLRRPGEAPQQPTSPAEFAAANPVLLVAAFFTASDEDLEWMEGYAAAGGHLVLGPRTGYADREGRARVETQPACLHKAAGSWYEEFSNLAEPVPVRAAGASEFGLEAGAVATDWVDCLNLVDAEPLAHYEHPHFSRWPALTTRPHGSGRVTVIGTVPGQAFARSIAAWLVPAPVAGWGRLLGPVRATTATVHDGCRLHFLHNWSWHPGSVSAPVQLEDAISGERFDLGDQVTLKAWDVRVLRAKS
jgi:beta-galactosidase